MQTKYQIKLESIFCSSTNVHCPLYALADLKVLQASSCNTSFSNKGHENYQIFGPLNIFIIKSPNQASQVTTLSDVIIPELPMMILLFPVFVTLNSSFRLFRGQWVQWGQKVNLDHKDPKVIQERVLRRQVLIFLFE